MKYNIDTKKLAVIGSPIAHSLSPAIHNRIAEIMGLNCLYLPFLVEPSGLEDWVGAARTFGLSGFNVTMPHKTEIIRHLDEVSEDSAQFGAVNTVVNQSGRLIGYNTDAGGLRLSVEEAGYTFKNNKIAVFGAGGAASAIVLGVLRSGAEKVIVYNRSPQKAKELERLAPDQITARNIDQSDFENDIGLIINAVPSDATDHLKLAGEIMKSNKNAAVFDICYYPAKTELLKIAKSESMACANGLGMLIYQAILAFELIMNVQTDMTYLKKTLEKELSINIT